MTDDAVFGISCGKVVVMSEMAGLELKIRTTSGYVRKFTTGTRQRDIIATG